MASELKIPAAGVSMHQYPLTPRVLAALAASKKT